MIWKNELTIKSPASAIDGLSAKNQLRVAEIVESCLIALERGAAIEPASIVAANPDLAEPLQRCLTSLVTLHEAVHGADDTLPNHPVLTVGGRLGDFVLGDIIGRGGMGVVYSAHQTSLDRRVAIKLLPYSSALLPTQLQRFMLEAKAVAQLHHSNIVPIYTVGKELDLHYYTMQLIDGTSLDKVQQPRWTHKRYRDFLKVAVDLADALRHAHVCGIIHRDIKPSNLLLDRNGKIWITDFGLARCKYETSLTLTGDLLGTVNYMSPEQALGKPVDERTDIYSLGVTLYEMLAGQQAFSGQVRHAVLRSIEHDEPTQLRKLQPDVPYDLETVILKAMSKDREDRYSSAAEMLYDLEAVRDGLPIDGRRPSLLRIGSRWAARHRALVYVAATGLLATMLVATIGAAQVLLAHNELKNARDSSQLQRAVADSTYWQGRSLIERWNRDLIHRLADIPGAEAVHAKMLADTIDYYQWFINKNTSPDPRLAPDIAAAYVGLGQALEQRGDFQASIENYILAVNWFEKLADNDPEHMRSLAMARNDLAVVMLRIGNSGEAIKQLQLAAKCMDSIDSPANSDQSYVAAVFANLARANQLVGNSADENIYTSKAEALYRQSIAKDPLNLDLKSELATVLDHRALLLAESNPSVATQLCREAVELHKQCNSTASTPRRSQRLGASLHNFAVLLHRAGQTREARSRFQQAIEVKEALAKFMPTRTEYWMDLAVSYNSLGQFEQQSTSRELSQKNLRLAEASLRRIQTETGQPLSISGRILLAEVLCNLVNIVSDPQESVVHKHEIRAILAEPTELLSENERERLKQLRLQWDDLQHSTMSTATAKVSDESSEL
jgi:eukaryotic-like serine/threonine-protein kinase